MACCNNSMKQQVNICWFRRDFRLFDNAALYQALKSNGPVLPVFIFDRNILDQLEDRKDARVHFIHRAVTDMQSQLQQMGSGIKVYYGFPEEIWKTILEEYDVSEVFASHDYEPYSLQRDKNIADLLASHGATLHTLKDHVIFEKNEVLKDDGTPYTVFTPYSKKWKAKCNDFYLSSYACENYFHHFFKWNAPEIMALEQMGFHPTSISFPAENVSEELMKKYKEQRDFPALQGTSRISVHLRFGTVSIRQLMRQAKQHSEKFFDELIWREFYQSVLWHFPQVTKQAFRKEYDNIEWLNNEEHFQKWCAGKTGFPLVDAGMRELNATGYMHNRVRMVVASFLTKDLLIDWRWGEAYFAQKLLDFELASNNGGWQWAAGTGVDAAPYFRIFNPNEQAKKFDSEIKYIRQWVPELDTLDYPPPMIDRSITRHRTMEVYQRALKGRN